MNFIDLKNQYQMDLAEIQSNARGFMSSCDDRIIKDLSHGFSVGGRLIRSLLSLCIHDSLTPAVENEINAFTKYLALLELIHSVSLAQDDVIDEDIQRRNRPTLYALYGPKKAILLSDYIICQIIKSSYFETKNEMLSKLHTEYLAAISNVVMGELFQFPNPGGVDLSDIPAIYDEVIKYKTGSLFKLAGQIYSTLYQLEETTKEKIHSLCEDIGILYQKIDDLRDLCSAGMNSPVKIEVYSFHFSMAIRVVPKHILRNLSSIEGLNGNKDLHSDQICAIYGSFGIIDKCVYELKADLLNLRHAVANLVDVTSGSQLHAYVDALEHDLNEIGVESDWAPLYENIVLY